MSHSTTRKKVFVCNLLITILCVLSIFSYFYLPFWKVNASYTLTAETIEELITKAAGDASEDVTPDEDGMNIQEALKDLDFNQIVDGDLTISISITLQTENLLASLSTPPTDLVKAILEENVHHLVDDLTPVIDKTAKNLVKALTKTVLHEQLKEQVKANLGEDATHEEVIAELESLGIDEEYIDTKIDTLVDTLYEEGTTTDSAADAIVDVVETTLNDMQSNSDENFTLSEEDKAELKEEIKNILSEIADEEGNLNLDEFTTSLLLGLLNKDKEQEENPTQPAAVIMRTNVSSESPDMSEEESELSEELKLELTNFLMNALDENTLHTVAQSLQIVAYVILFSLFTWAYLILKILLKLGMKNNAIKLKLPILLGSLPCWFLYIVPTATFTMLQSPSSPIAGMLPEAASKVIANLSITFSSCSIVSFAVGVFFTLFVIVYYGRLRRKLKLMKRGHFFEEE